MSEKRATFRRFDECTPEDIQTVGENFKALADGLPDRVLAHLKLLDGDFGGFNVDRLEHSLQTATRAHRDGRNEEYVVCALLHDIGDTLGTYDHGAVAAAILKPFISEANHWMLENHTVFQGYYYFEHLGGDKNARDVHKDSPHFEHTKEFIEKYDMPAFDENYDSMSLEEFEPMVRRVMSKDPLAPANAAA
ncbi:MAG: HD domain-containing protein [Gammaproteobacteria bacterium]